VPDRQGPGLLAARHLRLAGLAPEPPPGRPRNLGRPVPGATGRRLPQQGIHDRRDLRRRPERQRQGQGDRAHRPQARLRPQACLRSRGDDPCARRPDLPRGRRATLRQARSDQRGRAEPDDPLGRPPRRADGPRRRRLHGDARPQGDARGVRQTPEGAGERGSAPGPVQGRRGRGHRRDRRGGQGQQAHVPLPGQGPESPPEAGRGPDPGIPAGAEAAHRGPANLRDGRRDRRLGPLGHDRGRRVGGRDPLGPDPQAPRGRGPPRPVPRGPDDLSVGPRTEPGRRDALLRPPVAVSQGPQPRRRAAQARWPGHREGPGRPLPVGPDLRPRPPVREVRGPGRVRRRGPEEGAGRLPGLRRRQGALRQPRPPRRRPAGPPELARRRGRTAQARRRLRPRRRYGRPRDLGGRPPLPPPPGGRSVRDLGGLASPGHPPPPPPPPRPQGGSPPPPSAPGVDPRASAWLGSSASPWRSDWHSRPTSGAPRTGRSRRSRSTNGRSGSGARPRTP